MEHPSHNLFHNPRIIGSIILSVVFVAGVFFATHTKEQPENTGLSVKDAAHEGTHQDLDVDGLALWQEELWGTDPENPDTDEDGTSDGDEVKFGRDPNKKGPKDREEDAVLATSTRYYDDDPTLTTTDVIARDLYSGAIALDSSGQLTDQNLGVLVEGLIEKAQSHTTPILPPYTPSDIRISDMDGIEAYRVYFNGVALIMLNTNAPTLSEKEAIAMWTSNNLAERKSIARKQIAQQQALIDGLIALAVPPDLTKPHLSIVNALGESREILSRLGNRTNLNPVEDLVLLQEFQDRGVVIEEGIDAFFASPMLAAISWDESDPVAQLLESTQEY